MACSELRSRSSSWLPARVSVSFQSSWLRIHGLRPSNGSPGPTALRGKIRSTFAGNSSPRCACGPISYRPSRTAIQSGVIDPVVYENVNAMSFSSRPSGSTSSSGIRSSVCAVWLMNLNGDPIGLPFMSRIRRVTTTA